MSANFDDARTDTIPVTKHEAEQKVPHFIRKFAVPIIIGWIALIAVLNVVVPQLDEVGKMRSVSMAPDDAQSVVATKRMGAVFNEYKSNSSVMIVWRAKSPWATRPTPTTTRSSESSTQTPNTLSTFRICGAIR